MKKARTADNNRSDFDSDFNFDLPYETEFKFEFEIIDISEKNRKNLAT
jgi:hypothetical protein